MWYFTPSGICVATARYRQLPSPAAQRGCSRGCTASAWACNDASASAKSMLLLRFRRSACSGGSSCWTSSAAWSCGSWAGSATGCTGSSGAGAACAAAAAASCSLAGKLQRICGGNRLRASAATSGVNAVYNCCSRLLPCSLSQTSSKSAGSHQEHLSFPGLGCAGPPPLPKMQGTTGSAARPLQARGMAANRVRGFKSK